FGFDAGARADARHLGLFKISVDPETVGVDDRESGSALARVIAGAQQQVGDVTTYWTADFGALQVYLGLSDLMLGGFECGCGLDCIAGVKLLLLWRGREARELAPSF